MPTPLLSRRPPHLSRVILTLRRALMTTTTTRTTMTAAAAAAGGGAGSRLTHRTIRRLLEETAPETPLRARGWVRSVRAQKSISFVIINDGSSLKGLQCVVASEIGKSLTTGAAVEMEGVLVESAGKEQSKELRADKVTVIGPCNAETYPMQKKHHSVEFLRENAHLRARQNTAAAMLRVRNAALVGAERYLQENDFICVQTPIITSHDCEGGGDVFAIMGPTSSANDRVGNDSAVASGVPASSSSSSLPPPSHFFGKPVYLTVSGQLHAEVLASSLSRVYTFGPVFRAEESQTSRHLAEFWMLEAEVAFLSGLDELADVTEGLVHAIARHILSASPDEVEFFGRHIDADVPARLQSLADQPFARMTYTDAIRVLQDAVAGRTGVDFETKPEWGRPLQPEHERFLAGTHARGPVFVTDYPQDVKPFYMRANDPTSPPPIPPIGYINLLPPSPTVACFDLLVPGVGEIVGGSLREERLDRLTERMIADGLDVDDYAWYLDLRRYGSVPHGGFGLGFERLVAMMTGIESVKECLAFPRWAGRCKY